MLIRAPYGTTSATVPPGYASDAERVPLFNEPHIFPPNRITQPPTVTYATPAPSSGEPVDAYTKEQVDAMFANFAPGLIPRSVSYSTVAVNRDALYVDATSGNKTITLPTPTLGAQVTVAKSDTSTHTVSVSDGTTVVASITDPQASSTFLADGLNWRILMSYVPNVVSSATINALKTGYLSNITAKTAAYTAAAGDYVMATTTSAAFVVTGPAAPTTGMVVGIKKVSSDANAVTFTPAAGTVDGSANFPITVFEQENIFTFDGTNWQVS